MIYSRMLYTEHENPENEDNEGGYTVFSTQQSLGINYIPLNVVCMQKFAVLWEGTPDTRVIDLIEQAIVMQQLSPVKVLHASKGTLFIAYDVRLDGELLEDFEEAWGDIASGVLYDSWTTVFIKEGNVGQGSDGGRLFRKYVPGILAANVLGITGYTADMFLFWEDWKAENIDYGAEPMERGILPDDPYDFGFSDDVKFEDQ
jgi:hypothetical protein